MDIKFYVIHDYRWTNSTYNFSAMLKNSANNMPYINGTHKSSINSYYFKTVF